MEEKLVRCNLLGLAQQAIDHFDCLYGDDLKSLQSRVELRLRQLCRQLVDYLKFGHAEMLTTAKQVKSARMGFEEQYEADPIKLVLESSQGVVMQIHSILSGLSIFENLYTEDFQKITESEASCGIDDCGPAGHQNTRQDEANATSNLEEQRVSSNFSNAILSWADGSESSDEDDVGRHDRPRKAGDNVRVCLEDREASAIAPVILREVLAHSYTDDQLQKIFSILRAQHTCSVSAENPANFSETDDLECNDCGRIDSSVTWASVSYGVFLCLNCAGIHRGLGVEVSFVRSCIMDKWSWRELLRMACVMSKTEFADFEKQQGGRDLRGASVNGHLVKERYRKMENYRGLLDQREALAVKNEIGDAERYLEKSLDGVSVLPDHVCDGHIFLCNQWKFMVDVLLQFRPFWQMFFLQISSFYLALCFPSAGMSCT